MTLIDFSQISNTAGSQPFVTTFNQSGDPLHHAPKIVLTDNAPSTVLVTEQDQHILKLIRPRKWQEYFKLLWGHSRYQKEIKGNYMLRKIGLQVPEIYETAIGIIPTARYRYLGYYVMENLSKRGFSTLLSQFKNPDLSVDERQQLFEKMLAGLKRMKLHRIVFTDFHLENVMVNQSGELAWIDTGITHYPWYRAHLMRGKLKKSIERLARFHGNDFFTAHEKQSLKSLVNK